MAVLFAAVITVVLSGICLESYKRHRDRQGVASAISGEIYSILHMQEKRQHARFFAALLPRLDAGEQVPFPNVVGDDPPKLDPVVEKHIDRIGLLPDNVPERITTFYTYLRGIRVDLINLTKGVFPEPAVQANIIRADLALWGDTEQLGAGLGVELRTIASEDWWPLAQSKRLQTRAWGFAVASWAKITRQATLTEVAPPQPYAEADSPSFDQALTDSATPASNTVQFAPHYQDFVTEVENLIDTNLPGLMARLNIDRERAYRNVAIDYFAALHLERSSRFLFGSQIDALNFLVTNNSRATRDEIRKLYDAAAAAFPAIYASYSFDSWLGFMQNWGLINAQESLITLLPTGRALIPYMEGRMYLARRPPG